MKKLLIFYRGKKLNNSGNNSTATHLKDILCQSFDATVVQSSEIVKTGLHSYDIDVAIGIHLFHSGRAFLDAHANGASFPFILVVGGTDVYEFNDDPKSQGIMEAAVSSASYVVCFSDALRLRCLDLFGNQIDAKFRVIGPSIKTAPSTCLEMPTSLLQSKLPSVYIEKYVIVVANLRPVKDVLYVAQEFSDFVSKKNFPLIMIVVGGVIDEQYSKSVIEKTASLDSVYYLGPLPKNQVHCLIQGALVSINSSIFEGLAVTILEAMQLGTLVMARHNTGNAAIISHFENGVLFNNPAEFVSFLHLILNNPETRKDIVERAQCYVNTYHRVSCEKKSYERLCLDVIPTKDVAAG